jgi:endonuclease/exonuclease/phosphatase (EEP) superfamily protein YafD
MRFFKVSLALSLLALLGISLTGCLAGWPGDMITPFRVQLLICGAAGLGLAAVTRQRWIIALAVTAIAANALPMATRAVTRPVLPATASQGQGVSLVFSNVLCDNRDFERVVALAETQNADIFAAAETTPEWTRHLGALKSRYPYSFSPGLGVFGVSLYAKRPFQPDLYRLGRHHMPLLRADFGDLVVYVAHPMPPANARLTYDNEEYMRDLADLVGNETRPVIVAGDLNATLWSHSLSPLMKRKMQWPQGSGMAYSWPTGRSWLRIQIDQILTKGAIAGHYRTLPNVGSDHYPVRADLMF